MKAWEIVKKIEEAGVEEIVSLRLSVRIGSNGPGETLIWENPVSKHFNARAFVLKPTGTRNQFGLNALVVKIWKLLE